jgi:hypothetical protein
LTRPSPQQGLRELRERETPVCVCVCDESATPLPLSHRSPAPQRRASERVLASALACMHSSSAKASVSLSLSLSLPQHRDKDTPCCTASTSCVPSHFGRFTNVSERDRGRASMSPSAVSCAAPSAGEPVRPVVIEPTAKALSATPKHTRTGGKTRARWCAHFLTVSLERRGRACLVVARAPLSKERLELWALAQATKPLSREARAFGLAPCSRPSLSLEKLELSGSRPARRPPLPRRESLHSRVPTVHFLGALG